MNFIKKNISLIIASVVLVVLMTVAIFGIVATTNKSELKINQDKKINNYILSNENMLISKEIDENGELYSYDYEGELVASLDFPSYIIKIEKAEDKILVALGNKDIYVLNNKLEVLNTYESFPYMVIHMAIADDILYVAGSIQANKNIIGVSEKLTLDGNALPEMQYISSTSFPVSLTFSDENLLVAEENGNIKKIIKTNGQFKLVKAFEKIDSLADMKAYNNKIYTLSKFGVFSVLENENVVFKKQIADKGGYLDISSNGKFIAIATDDGSFAIYNSKTGKLSVSNGLTLISSVSVNSNGNAVILKQTSQVMAIDYSNMGVINFYEHINIFLYIVIVLVLFWLIICILSVNKEKRDKIILRFKEIWAGKKSYLMLLPTLILLAIFCYYPIIWGFSLAFKHYVPGSINEWVGWQNFIDTFNSQYFWVGIENMIIFLVTDLAKAIIPPFILAEVMNALLSKKTSYWAKLAMFVPGIIPGIAALLIWQNGILGYGGLINQIFEFLNIESLAKLNILGEENTAVWGLVLIGFPWVGSYIIFCGALLGVDKSLYDATEIDGCSYLKRVLKIDLPLISAQIKYIFVITFIGSIQDFGRVYLTTGGAPGISTYIPALELFYNINLLKNYGVASAMGILMFIVVFGATIINLKMKTEDI